MLREPSKPTEAHPSIAGWLMERDHYWGPLVVSVIGVCLMIWLMSLVK